jgi:rod shape-determining protein MreD
VEQEYPLLMMNRRTLLLLAIALTALIQARLLPEVGLETLFNLPLFVLLLLSSVRRRSTLIAGAFIAGFLLDALLWRPLGQSALTLSVAVLVAAAARGDGDAGWARRSAAATVGYAAAAAFLILSSNLLGVGTTAIGSGGPERLAINIALLVLGSAVGARRRAQQLRERPLDDRLS